MSRLQGKNVFITGAAAGLGRGYIEVFLERGANIFFSDLDATQGEQTLKELSAKYGAERIHFSPLDCSDIDQIEVVWNKAVKEMGGRIDLVINNAGVMNESIWQIMIKVNYEAVVKGTELAFAHMRKDKGGKGGRIINISSIAGLRSACYNPVYSGTKHAVRAYTSCLAVYPNIKELGIELSVLCPDAANTDLINNVDGEKMLFLDQIKDDLFGRKQPVENVVAGMLKLVELQESNGAILFVQKERMSYRKIENVDLGTEFHSN